MIPGQKAHKLVFQRVEVDHNVRMGVAGCPERVVFADFVAVLEVKEDLLVLDSEANHHLPIGSPLCHATDKLFTVVLFAVSL